jgi:hypothetical protein
MVEWRMNVVLLADCRFMAVMVRMAGEARVKKG